MDIFIVWFRLDRWAMHCCCLACASAKHQCVGSGSSLGGLKGNEWYECQREATDGYYHKERKRYERVHGSFYSNETERRYLSQTKRLLSSIIGRINYSLFFLSNQERDNHV